MRLMFVYWAFEDQGSGLVIQGYTQAARALGHEVAVYGRPNPRIPLNYSMDIDSADAIVFIFEWTTYLRNGDSLDFSRLVASVPRQRRVILDGDGNYNDVINVEGDYNHRDVAASQHWIDVCDSLSDKICQPTLHPLRSNVYPFLFYAYNPAWEAPLDFSAKEYGMLYVGHCKSRWPPMQRVLRAIEPVRDQVGRIGLVGSGWGSLPWWAEPMQMADVYFSDASYLSELGVEMMPPVPFEQVLTWMGKARFNPVLLRPTFNRLRLVNPRMFETLAANTIPLFALDEGQVREIYGDSASELTLMGDPSATVLDITRHPQRYRSLVARIRQHLASQHSHVARLQQLIGIVES